METEMVFFACSKIGVAAFESLWRDNNDHQLWVDADVLTEEEIAVLRSTGALVTNFAGHARAGDAKEMACAVAVIQEHHPAEPIWIEAA
ncbi:hypothetical protein WJ53_16850 [Burkholderia ubonensis]|uniref:RmlD-like substrate binding domain-containing protein n=2 Tax=Burkholderia ubonensis TaxID=101571 RepID=A0AB73FTE9_9BURK|nr:hypothetical protein WJ44_01240 [Burkholderia ubonensis]KVM22774.1 hypothetical protein WJ54_22645 [Burkholderia ubonensis]KVM24135.1 hypothetical protein WJ53_16850 [Burkholderia ubonensis]KVR17320.1 hypothetical protein WK13_08415 [Burkholderia ubonensis]KVT65831.1 hypothetical protein WK54_31010 [Burkholderia ubonensis]